MAVVARVWASPQARDDHLPRDARVLPSGDRRRVPDQVERLDRAPCRGGVPGGGGHGGDPGIHVALLPAIRRAGGVRSGQGSPPGPAGGPGLLACLGDHARRPRGLLGRTPRPGCGVPGDERLVLAGRRVQLRHGFLAALRPVRYDTRRPAMSGPGDFVHLQVRSSYSLMRGAASLEALCTAAAGRGMRAIACTDVDGLYGVVRFREIALECGLRPILGAEVTTPEAEIGRAHV